MVTGTVLSTREYPVHQDWHNMAVLIHSSYTQIWFGLRCFFPIWRDWNIRYTTKGSIKLATSRAIKFMTATLAFLLAYRAYKSGMGLNYFRLLFLQLSLRSTQVAQQALTRSRRWLKVNK